MHLNCFIELSDVFPLFCNRMPNIFERHCSLLNVHCFCIVLQIENVYMCIVVTNLIPDEYHTLKSGPILILDWRGKKSQTVCSESFFMDLFD